MLIHLLCTPRKKVNIDRKWVGNKKAGRWESGRAAAGVRLAGSRLDENYVVSRPK